MAKRKALVTGGSGFLGQYLVKELSEAGWSVRVLDILQSEDTSMEFICADIRDLKKCVEACLGIDVVFHSVAQVPLAKDKALFESVNIQGTENILRASVSQNIKHFVHVSSSAVFGLPSKMPANKYSTLHPIEVYGQTKLRGEHLIAKFRSEIPNTAVIRPRTILGSGRLGLFSIIFDWVSEGLDVFVFDGGDHRYQFINVKDLAKGIVSASSVKGHSIFNLGAIQFNSLRDDLEELCRYAGTGSRVRSIPGILVRKPALLSAKLGIIPFANYQILLYSQEMYFDSEEDWNLLSVTPKYNNSQSLIQSYEWFLENKNVLQSQRDKSMHNSISKGKSLNLMKALLRLI